MHVLLLLLLLLLLLDYDFCVIFVVFSLRQCCCCWSWCAVGQLNGPLKFVFSANGPLKFVFRLNSSCRCSRSAGGLLYGTGSSTSESDGFAIWFVWPKESLELLLVPQKTPWSNRSLDRQAKEVIADGSTVSCVWEAMGHSNHMGKPPASRALLQVDQSIVVWYFQLLARSPRP